MSTTKTNSATPAGHRVVLEEFRAAKAAAGDIEIEVADGTVFRVPAPELWSDDIQRLAFAGDNVGMARALLGGPEAYEAFVAAGGSANLLGAILTDTHGVTPGKSPASRRS